MNRTTRQVAVLATLGLAPLAALLGIVILFVAAIATGAAQHQNDNAELTTATGPAAQITTGGQVPDAFMPWINKASAACTHTELTPALLAAQLRAESDFSTDRSLKSSTGAMGPAQFMPATWTTWGRDADGDGIADPYDIADAVMAQGRFMCSLIGKAKKSGISGDPVQLALAGYNAGWGRVLAAGGIPDIQETRDYITKIMTWAQEMSVSPTQVSSTGTGAAIVNAALAQQGVPYVWGGGGIHGKTGGGFDCSGLTQYAVYVGTGGRVTIPRTSQTQRTAGVSVPRDQMQPGDLVVINDDGNWGHVGIYIGNGKMVHAPRPGKTVEITVLDTSYWTKYQWDVRRVA